MPVLPPKLAILSLQQEDQLVPETACQTSVAVHFKEEAKQFALFFQRDLLEGKRKKKKESRREHKVAAYKKDRKQVY